MASSDRGYAWIVLSAAFLQHILFACPLGSMGIFLVEIKAHFQCSQTEVSLVAMLSFVVGMLLGKSPNVDWNVFPILLNHMHISDELFTQ